MKTPVEEVGESMQVVALHPSLEEVVRVNGLNRKRLTVGLKRVHDKPDVAAGLVGLRPVSAAEFEAIFGRLARSASHFRLGEASRNYMWALRSTIGQLCMRTGARPSTRAHVSSARTQSG